MTDQGKAVAEVLYKVFELSNHIYKENVKKGLSAKCCDMYVTAFPCHECARLIVASGIKNVFFIEPYPKSRVAEMYDDSIIVDEDGDDNHVSFRAFVGVAPHRYIEFFEAPEPTGRQALSEVKRREDDGSPLRWEKWKDTRWPRRFDLPVAIMTREQNSLEQFQRLLADKKLKRPVEESPT